MKSLLRRPLVWLAAFIALVVLWALFRPELLFVNKSVDEPFPSATSTLSAPIRTVV